MNYIFDGDLRSFFDSVSQEWLVRFLKHRIADSRMIRLIQKWLKAGILKQFPAYLNRWDSQQARNEGVFAH